MEKARHPKAASLARGRFFNGVRTFADVERKISKLRSVEARIEVFQVFVEAFLATQPIVQAKSVWPIQKLPLRFSRFRGRDEETCGVVETKRGTTQLYYTVFCVEDEEVDIAGLEEFAELARTVELGILVTNTVEVPEEVKNILGRFYVVSGHHLHALTPAQVNVIICWIHGQAKPVPKKNPQPHQEEALDKIVPAARMFSRITTLMPCGTGKTLVQLWMAEKLNPKTILVLLPSLALVRQTLHEWIQETRWSNVSFLCVCSDRTVANGTEDTVELSQTDLDFPVTRDSGDVASFLATSFPGVKIVFSTYHSSSIVANGMEDGFVFDLGVFDEAHKTAGEEGGLFSFGLHDKNLPIAVRTFWTATPRHYDLSKFHGESIPVLYSMDDEDIYGPVVHQLAFREAVDKGIICDYEVLVSVVTSRMLGKEAIESGGVDIDGTIVPARIIAHHMALVQAIERFGVRKIFSFHPSVEDAREFTNGGPQSVARHLPEGFVTLHVSGKMPTVQRARQMNAFREAKRAIISNARCLTEGVDVPSVDLVAFLSKKRSLIDIVQATGRAMRRAPMKEKGYILVPLYVEQDTGETLEEAVARADFREVWAVLNAMREQDEALAQTMSRIRVEKGKDPDRTRGRRPKDVGIDKVTVLGPSVDIRELRKAITTICVDRFTSNWDEMYGRLLAFKEEHGHCNVPVSDLAMGRWVSQQRLEYNKGILKEDHASKLTQIGFVWKPMDDNWDEMYGRLLAFKEEHGHCNVPDKDGKLGAWVVSQRMAKRRGILSQKRVSQLSKIKFVWDKRKADWDRQYFDLVAYNRRYGHTNVPARWPRNRRLAAWVNTQRQLYKSGLLQPDRQEKLSSLGFIWQIYGA